MNKLILLLCVLFSSMALVAQSAREVTYRGADLAPQNIVPTFEHGYLAVYDADEKINIYAPDGSFAFSIRPSHGGHVFSVAMDTDGAVAVTNEHSAYDESSGIVVLDRAGIEKAYFTTGDFRPTHICFASDHSIWAAGLQQREPANEDPDFLILRHYSRDGKELGAYLPRSSFEPSQKNTQPAGAALGHWLLRVANNRVGIHVSFQGLIEGVSLWVEIGPDGKELGRWSIPSTFEGYPAAFTEGGLVYAQSKSGVGLLNQGAGQWNLIAAPSDGKLIGADGDDLVFWLRGQGRLRYVASSL
jgi:hypothetical protein